MESKDMCDLFALSSSNDYTPHEYLPLFAEKGKGNMNGWGIGFFRDNQAFVEKSSEQVYSGRQVHESFQRLARVIDSRIIISHISCPLSGGRHTADNHPFVLPFLGHNWLFVHVGVVEGIENYKTTLDPHLDSRAFPARVFEYLRDHMVGLVSRNPYLSLYDALRNAIQEIAAEYPGRYTFFLANESVLFVFCNFHPIMLLRESETSGEVLLVTSVREGLSSKEWLVVRPEEHCAGKLLVIAGPDVLYGGDV